LTGLSLRTASIKSLGNLAAERVRDVYRGLFFEEAAAAAAAAEDLSAASSSVQQPPSPLKELRKKRKGTWQWYSPMRWSLVQFVGVQGLVEFCSLVWMLSIC
jgi:hypothetical protein